MGNGMQNNIEMNGQINELVVQIARSLVDRPDEVDLRCVESNRTLVLELRVAKDDIGKVIGKQGRTAQAMRILLGAISAKGRKNAVLEILE